MLPNTSRLHLDTRRDASVDASFPPQAVRTAAETLQGRIAEARLIAVDAWARTKTVSASIRAFSERFTAMERIAFGEDLAKQAWTLFSSAPDVHLDAVDDRRKIHDGWGTDKDIRAWKASLLSGRIPFTWRKTPASFKPWSMLVRLTPLSFAYMKTNETTFALKATLLLDFKRQYDEKVQHYLHPLYPEERRYLETTFFDNLPRSFNIPGVGAVDDFTLDDSILPMLREAYNHGILQTPTGHFMDFMVLRQHVFEVRVPSD